MNNELPVWYDSKCNCEMCENYRLDVLEYVMQTAPYQIEPFIDIWEDTFEFIEKL